MNQRVRMSRRLAVLTLALAAVAFAATGASASPQGSGQTR